MFGVTVLVVGLLRHSYDHRIQFVSELGETGSEYSIIMNYFGFMIPATLIALFTLNLISLYSQTTVALLASILLAIFVTGMFFAGIFSCDQTCLPTKPTSHQLLHNLVSFVAFVALIVSSLFWGIYFTHKPEWYRFAQYSLVTSALATIFLVLMILSVSTRNDTGLYQRLFLATLFIWMAFFAHRVWRNHRLSHR